MTTDIFERLKAPFPATDIEWRIQQSGKTKDGRVWAKVLAYIEARAAQDRLDEVVGPQNWTVYYKVLDKRIKGRLAIKVGDAWIAKEDGAEETDIEAFKGGLSSAFKRVASVWGVGRYLYHLPEGWATIVDKQEGAYFSRLKDETSFYWRPPELPKWALPESEVKKDPEKRHGDFDIKFGKFKGTNTAQLSIDQLAGYYKELYENIEVRKIDPPPQGFELYNKLKDYLEMNS